MSEGYEVNTNGEVIYVFTLSLEEFFTSFNLFICSSCLSVSEFRANIFNVKKCEHCGGIEYDQNLHLINLLHK